MYFNENFLKRVFRQCLIRHIIEAIREHALAVSGIDTVKCVRIAANERFDLALIEGREPLIVI
jgi:hypothetical protein